MNSQIKTPSLLDILLPIVALVLLLSLSVYLFGDDSLSGSNQLALSLAAVIAALVGIKNGYRWSDIVEGVNSGISMAISPIVILLSIGSLIGVWILSGTVPAMIYYGLAILSPDWFYLSACLIAALVSLCVGSSWTTAGTIGIGLMGVAITMGLSPAISAGAIISGAYFGDKLSPLSDTTNLAPSVAGSELFEHIRHMLWTTVPSFIVALVFFMLVADAGDATSMTDLQQVRDSLNSQFGVAWYLLAPLPLLLFLIARKIPALPAIWGGIAAGIVVAVLFQADNAQLLVADSASQFSPALQLLKGVWMALAEGYSTSSQSSTVNDLLSKGGMSSMLATIWLIICAMAFGGVMEKTGLLSAFVQRLDVFARTERSLVTTTVCSAATTNLITSDQYISIVVPGRMFRGAFEKLNLAPVNLSRALEDGGTITSPLVPWNTCGAYMAATLGVATLSYLPFAIFCLVNPLIAIVYAQLQFKLVRNTIAEGSAKL